MAILSLEELVYQMKIHRTPAQLISTQLGLIIERLSLLESIPFDRVEYLVQASALLSDIQSALAYFVELKQWEPFDEIRQREGNMLEDLLQEIDYELAVIQLQSSSLRKRFPQDEDFYRSRLRKLRHCGEKLDAFRDKLHAIVGKYYL